MQVARPPERPGRATPDNAGATTVGGPAGSRGRFAQSWQAADPGPTPVECPPTRPGGGGAPGRSALDSAGRESARGDHRQSATCIPLNTQGSGTPPWSRAARRPSGHPRRFPARQPRPDAHAAPRTKASRQPTVVVRGKRDDVSRAIHRRPPVWCHRAPWPEVRMRSGSPVARPRAPGRRDLRRLRQACEPRPEQALQACRSGRLEIGDPCAQPEPQGGLCCCPCRPPEPVCPGQSP